MWWALTRLSFARIVAWELVCGSLSVLAIFVLQREGERKVLSVLQDK